MFNRLCLMISLLLINSLVLAVNNAEHCKSVLEHGARNYIERLDFNSQRSYVYAKACSDQYYNSSGDTQLGIEVIIKKVPLGIDFNSSSKKEQVQAWCKENESLADNYVYSKQTENLVYGSAVDAWLSCKLADSAGLKVKTDLSPDSTTIAFHITNDTTDDNIVLRGVDVSEDSVKCKIKTDKKTTKASSDSRVDLKPNKPINVVCSRDKTSVSRDDQKINIIPASTITINTALDNYQVSFPEKSIISLTDKKAEEINATLNFLTDSLGKVGKGECENLPWVNRAPLQNSADCPVGTYMKGLNFRHKSGNDYAFQMEYQIECCGF